MAVELVNLRDAASLLGWSAASRWRDGSAPEASDGGFERDVAALYAALDEPARRELDAIGRAWSLPDVLAASTRVAAAAPELAAVDGPDDASSLAAARRIGLTARELEIATRLADRRTDQEIADELFISVRTVTTHVSAVLRKLDVRSRRDVATRAGELGLLTDSIADRGARRARGPT